MRSLSRTTLLSVLLATIGAVPAFAQTTVDSTTLSAAVTATDRTVSVTSATNVAVGQTLFVDHEAMKVNTKTGTVLGVTRGYNGTAARAHGALATIYAGDAGEFYTQEVVQGSKCTLTDELFTPRIVLPTGNVYKCSGMATQGAWEQIGSEAGAIYVTCRALLIADMVDQSCFIADRDYVVAQIQEVHKTKEAGGTLTLIARKNTGTQAPASGASLGTALDMAAAATDETVRSVTLTTTAADLLVASGGRLSLDFTDDTAGELAGVTVTFKLIPR